MCGSRGDVSLPLAPCSGPLLVLDGDNKEDQQGDALDPRQEEEVVVQGAVVDITWKEKKTRTLLEKSKLREHAPSPRLQTAEKRHRRLDDKMWKSKTASRDRFRGGQREGSFITKYYTVLKEYQRQR